VAVGGIGVPASDQLPDHRDDLGDMGGRGRLHVRRELAGHAEGRHVLAVGGGIAVGDGRDRGAGLARGGIDLVVDVGDVAGVAQRAEAPTQQRGQHPEHHRPAGVSDVHVVVHGRPAQVHGRAGGVERRERLDPSRQAVVQAQAHRGCSAGGPPF
jgi:hypothetical protein